MNSFDALTDVEFLDLIVREFAARPSLRLLAGVVVQADGEGFYLLTTTGELPDATKLRDIADHLEQAGTLRVWNVRSPN